MPPRRKGARLSGTARRTRAPKLIGGAEGQQILAQVADLLNSLTEVQVASRDQLRRAERLVDASTQKLKRVRRAVIELETKFRRVVWEMASAHSQAAAQSDLFSLEAGEMSQILNRLQIAFVIVRADGLIRRISNLAMSRFGLSSKNVGASVYDLGLGIEAPELNELIRCAVLQDRVTEQSIRLPDGQDCRLQVLPFTNDEAEVEAF